MCAYEIRRAHHPLLHNFQKTQITEFKSVSLKNISQESADFERNEISSVFSLCFVSFVILESILKISSFQIKSEGKKDSMQPTNNMVITMEHLQNSLAFVQGNCNGRTNSLHTRWIKAAHPGSAVVQCWSCHKATPQVNFCVFCGNFVLKREHEETSPKPLLFGQERVSKFTGTSLPLYTEAELSPEKEPLSPVETTEGDSETDGSEDMDTGDIVADDVFMDIVPEIGTCV